MNDAFVSVDSRREPKFIGGTPVMDVDRGDGGNDVFRADKAWLNIVILTIGYLMPRT